MEGLPLAAKLYISIVTVAAVLLTIHFIAALSQPSGKHLALAIVFCAFEFLAGHFPIRYGRNAKIHINLHTSVVFASILVLPPGLALIVAGVGTLVAHVTRRRQVDEAMFNTSHSIVQTALASGILAAGGWRFDVLTFDRPELLALVLAAAAGMYTYDTVSIALIAAFSSRSTPLAVLRNIMTGFYSVETLLQLAIGVLGAVIADARPWALPLLLLPAWAAYRSSESNVQLREQTLVLEHQAFHDPLTGLPNRALFMDRLRHALTRARRDDGWTAVLFLDLDRFKFVNDSLGHEAGDELLTMVAARLVEQLRPGDTVARHGGDEFTILLDDVGGVKEATRVADRIAQALLHPFRLLGQNIYVTCSIGIVSTNSDGTQPEALLHDADIALYRAKSTGKAHYEVFDPRMGSEASDRVLIETDLKHALARSEFRLHYQPEVDLRTRRTRTVEALVRWEHPERGLVLPMEFIGIAEEIGLIVPLGRWILSEGCRQAQSWREEEPSSTPIRLSINISVTQFRHPELVADVAAVLASTGLPAHLLDLEITESVVIGDFEVAMETLRELKALGVRLVLDDFGTGYSSLSYLQRLPIDVVKIDKSFVDNLGQDQGNTAIIEAVMGLSRAFDFEVIAEGVERDEQVIQLQSLGCEMGQGYLFSKPLPSAQISALFDRTRQTA